MHQQKSTLDSVFNNDADHLKFDEDMFGHRHVLTESLSPMLKMMRIWGLYFGRYGRTWTRSQSRTTQLQEIECYHSSAGAKRQRVYPTVVLLILWVNVLRFFLAFEAGDKFNSTTINKTAYFLLFLQCAVIQTSYFIASNNGKLDQMLDRLNVTEKFADLIYKHSIACVAYNSLVAVFCIATSIYGMFLSQDAFNFAVAPFVTLIRVDGIWLNILKVASLLLFTFVMQSWVWPLMMNLVLTAILLLLFRDFNRHFHKALRPRGQFKGNVKVFRSRHLALSEVVQAADSFIRLGNVASIVCQMTAVIILLFQLTIIGVTDPFLHLNFSMLLVVNILGLAVCTCSGILVNNEVSFINNYYWLIEVKYDRCSVMNE
jgi:hypothetical protein